MAAKAEAQPQAQPQAQAEAQINQKDETHNCWNECQVISRIAINTMIDLKKCDKKITTIKEETTNQTSILGVINYQKIYSSLTKDCKESEIRKRFEALTTQDSVLACLVCQRILPLTNAMMIHLLGIHSAVTDHAKNTIEIHKNAVVSTEQFMSQKLLTGKIQQIESQATIINRITTCPHHHFLPDPNTRFTLYLTTQQTQIDHQTAAKSNTIAHVAVSMPGFSCKCGLVNPPKMNQTTLYHILQPFPLLQSSCDQASLLLLT